MVDIRRFAELYYGGEVTATEIDDFITEWHNCAGVGEPLHEYLGLTWAEYAHWLQHNRIPARA